MSLVTGFGLISDLPEVEAVRSHLLPPSGQNQNSKGPDERVQIVSEYKLRGLKASINPVKKDEECVFKVTGVNTAQLTVLVNVRK